MKLRTRYRKLNLWNKLFVWAAIATIVGLVYAAVMNCGIVKAAIFNIDLLIIRYNLIFAILSFIGWGMVVCVIPIILFFEIYHWAKNESQITWPYLKGILAGLIIGIISTSFFTIYSLINATGESGLALVGWLFIIVPFVVIGFVITGIFVATFYKWRKKPLLVKKSNKKS